MIFKNKINNTINIIQNALDSERIKMVEISKLKFDKDFKELFAQEPDKVERIYQDMLIRGFDKSQPIIVTKDNCILDGNSRFMAATKAGIKMVPVVYKTFADKNEAIKYELHLQLNRRNLSDAEILKMFKRLEELKNQSKKDGKPISEFTNSKIAAQLKKSERQVQKIRELTKKADNETLMKVETGEISINQAYSEIKKSEKQSDETISTSTVHNSDFKKGVMFTLNEIASGKSPEEILEVI